MRTAIAVIFAVCAITVSVDCFADTIISLPEIVYDETYPVYQAIQTRRSLRSYSDNAVTLSQLTTLLSSAQGITSGWGYRAAPSAGATFPSSIIVVAANVENLNAGIYLYSPGEESLTLLREGDFLTELSEASLGQPCVADAPLVIAIIADFSITTDVYGDRGITYVHMEAGHISQNIYLQCTELGLGTVAVGAFEDYSVSEVLQLDSNETPLYLMPVGWPAR